MPFNGAGTFVSLGVPTFPAVTGEYILASYFNATMNDVFAGLTNCVTRDGQGGFQANVSFSGFKITDLGDGTNAGDAVNFGQVFNGGTFDDIILTGIPTAPTAAPGTDTTQLATTAFAMHMESPAFEGIPTAPTAATGTATNQIATMQAILNQAFLTALPAQDATTKFDYPQSNGTAAAWRTAGWETVPPVASTLTNGGSYKVFNTNAAYVLPDFAGSSTFGLAVLSSSAAVPSTVTTSDGWTLATGFSAGTLRVIAPTSTETAHGTWGASAMTPPALGTLNAGTGPQVLGTLQLTSDVVIILFGVSSNTTGYVVALNTTTGAFGTAVSLGTTVDPSTGAPWTIYADSASTFVVGFSAATTMAVVAGSVSGTTITLGSAVAGSYTLTSPLIQLTTASYIYSNGANAEVFITSGITVAKGTNTSVAAGAASTVPVRLNSTQCLLVGSDGASPARLSACVVTVSGTVPAGGTVYFSATAVNSNAQVPKLVRSMVAGSRFIAAMQANPTTTTMNFYGLTVAGTVVTIGTVAPLLSGNTVASVPRYSDTHIYPQIASLSSTAVVYNASTLLFTTLSGGATATYAITISGTAITAGASFLSGGGQIPKVVTDAATGSNFYLVRPASTTVDKITVAGTTITSSYQLAVSPSVISSDTLNDEAVSYAGTWYAWTLPTMTAAVTATKWLAVSTPNIILYGPIA